MNRRIKLILLFFVLTAFTINAETLSSKAKKYKYQLSVTTIFQNEARFLKEWIEYHLLVGVEHFYLFNNLSTDDYLDVLQPYIDQGIVTLIQKPIKTTTIGEFSKIQNGSYTEAIKFSRGETKWLAIIDTDEFIVPVSHDNVLDILKDYTQYGGLVANWQCYGTSNVQRIPENGLMIENLLLRAEKDYTDNKFVKSIVRPERADICGNPHYCRYKKKHHAVNERKEKVPRKRTKQVLTDKIRINHYWTRDEEFFQNVKLAREEKFTRDYDYCIERRDAMNQVYDETMLRFVDELKSRMFNALELQNY